MNQFFAAATRRLLAAIAIASGISGCATTSMVGDPLKSPPVAGESPVVVSITSNTGQIRGFDTIYLTAYAPSTVPGAPSKPSMNTHIMSRVAPGMARDTALFVGKLPAGEYEIRELADLRSHKSLRVSGQSNGRLGMLTVSGDAPVDLGRLIITPLNEKVLYGRSERVTSNQELLTRFSPEYARLFAGQVKDGWNAPRSEDDEVERYALSRPVGADCVTELDDGRVAAASRLNTVLMREKDGRWHAARGPGIESLLCVLPVRLPDADLLAVGEFGALLKHAPGATTLTPVNTGNLPPGNLVRIAGNAVAGWYVAHQSGDDITLFHSVRLEQGDWKPVKHESVKASLWSGATQFFMWTTQNGFAYSLTGGPLQFFDFTTGQWTERALPENRRLTDMRIGANNLLSVLTGVSGGFGGVFGKVHVSNDEARTWTEIEGPYKVKIAPVVQLADGTMLLYGGALTKAELQASRDGGKTWAHHADYEHGRLMVPLKSGTVIDMDLGQFGVFDIGVSVDGARTWQTGYSTFDRKFYEMRQRANAAK